MPMSGQEVRAWTVDDSAELYNVAAWGDGYFGINEHGHVTVSPTGPDGLTLDLRSLADEIVRRGIRMPVVLRFPDILGDRVHRIHDAFAKAIEEYQYAGRYQGVYPIKVNQERLVVQNLVEAGRDVGLGLEAGSKPELLIALAMQTNPDAFLICNGYKDDEYIELCLLAEQLGRKTFIVIDRLEEVEAVIRQAKRLGVRPHLGVRTKLNARGAGRWAESTGDQSKFGLTPDELMLLVRRLEAVDMLECLELLHFHIGSQISAVRAIKRSLLEACRIFVELYRLGAPLGYLDVGGGLAVDYDGSHSNFASSSNYTLREYASDVVFAIEEACRVAGVPHPTIVSESGRALTAHHSILLFNVLGCRSLPDGDPPAKESGEHRVLEDLHEILQRTNVRNLQEYFHDALQLREEAQTLFNVGVFDLARRAKAETLFWLCCRRFRELLPDLRYVPRELRRLKRALADIYYCNFSVFQSMPDHWACDQLFPTLPIQRLRERPTVMATLADLTCDSDGKVDRFVGQADIKDVLELHTLREGEAYYLGCFLVGAYQEILGDLHNLFGDTHCLNIVAEEGEPGYRIEEFEDGETIQEVLSYVSYERRAMVTEIRRAAEARVKAGELSMEDSGAIINHYERSLSAYTYLEPERAGG